MPELHTLLFVDDEQDLRDIALEFFGTQYDVRVAESAEAARQVFQKSPPHVAILDVRMPGEDGLSLARWIRENYPHTGIVMLTTAAEVVDRIIGLELGADDYIAKPFDLREHRLYGQDGAEIAITSMEFDLLKVFAEHPNKVMNRDQIMELACHRDWDVYDRSIDLRVMRLRRKIEIDPDKPEVLKTVRGSGYMFLQP